MSGIDGIAQRGKTKAVKAYKKGGKISSKTSGKSSSRQTVNRKGKSDKADFKQKEFVGRFQKSGKLKSKK